MVKVMNNNDLKSNNIEQKEIDQLVELAKSDSFFMEDLLVKLYPYIVNIANKYIKKYNGLCELDDLIQIGSLAVLKAVDKYDPEVGVHFTTYAYHYIEGYIQNELNAEYNKTKNDIHVQSSVDDVENSENSNESEMEQFIYNNSSSSENETNQSNKTDLEYYIYNSNLDQRQIEIFSQKEGINTKQMSISELATKYNLSETRIYQIYNKALIKIKTKMDKDGLIVK